MPSLRSVLFSLLSIAPLVLSRPDADPSTIQPDTVFNFQELLNALPAESLHAALHKHASSLYQDGVYEHDRIAVENVHKEDPGTATKVLAEAALHLIKRQTSNDTSVATSTTTSAEETTTKTETTAKTETTSKTETTTATSNSDVIIPVEVATTDAAGSTSTLTTSAVAEATVSVVQTITTTDSKGSIVVASTTVAAAVVTQNGQVTTSPVPVFVNTPVATITTPIDVTTTDSKGQTLTLANVTPGKVLTATNAEGSTFVTTFTPGLGVKVSSLVLLTSTLPNGQRTTITSFAVVAADTAGASSTSTAGPKLQNGADSVRSRSFRAEAVALMGGAVGVAFFL